MSSLLPFRPGLWLTELHLHEFDVRGAVIGGTQRLIVWDTLSHPRDMAMVRPLVSSRWHAVVYSHADWDHCWGTAGLPERQLVIAHGACRSRFDADVPETLREKQAAAAQAWEAVELIPPSLTFQKQLSLDLGGVTLELHHLPGHTLDCLVGFVPEWGILLAGDTVETPLPVVNAESHMSAWLAGLQRWAADSRVQTVIPAHGEIGGREIIQKNIEYLQRLQEGRTSAEDFPVLPQFYLATHRENIGHLRRNKSGL